MAGAFGSLSLRWDGKPERGSLIRSTLYPNAPLMPFNEHLAQIEDQSEAQIQFMLDGTAFGTMEAFPNMIELFSRNDRPLIMD
ncbi:hypothetical protein KSD_41890 [Ktedonobacter sp. SOSP1-85]|nr:hypothetical protein KSD_41890 [Ktedonobacter sp. SOSP1-85]